MFNKNKNQRLYLLILCFVSGFTIMGIELSASRLIAPYYGSSNFIWTNIIGIIMIGLSLGYYWGGKLADRLADIQYLLRIIISACVYLLAIPFLAKTLIEAINRNLTLLSTSDAVMFFGSLISVALLFLVPILLLGMVSPYIIKLLSLQDTKIGNDAGLVFSISTVGSILGTFLPVLLFIPYLGTRKTIIIFALTLLITALGGLLGNKKSLLLYILIVPLVLIKLPAIKTSAEAITEGESVYQYFQVVDEGDRRNLIINEGMGLFSTYNKNTDEILGGMYFDNYNLLPYLSANKSKQDVLILGLAAGTISTQLNKMFGQQLALNIDGVEIDEKIIAVGNKYFAMANQALTVFNMDGRNYIDYIATKKYDHIIIDVYANQLYIPFHLTTLEFFKSAKEHLAPAGIVAMNVNAAADDSRILKNITNTMNKVFVHVYVIKDLKSNWNYLVLATDQALDFSSLEKETVNSELLPIAVYVRDNYHEVVYDSDFSYLTDDQAPIEYLTDSMIIDYLYKD